MSIARHLTSMLPHATFGMLRASAARERAAHRRLDGRRIFEASPPFRWSTMSRQQCVKLRARCESRDRLFHRANRSQRAHQHTVASPPQRHRKMRPQFRPPGGLSFRFRHDGYRRRLPGFKKMGKRLRLRVACRCRAGLGHRHRRPVIFALDELREIPARYYRSRLTASYKTRQKASQLYKITQRRTAGRAGLISTASCARRINF